MQDYCYRYWELLKASSSTAWLWMWSVAAILSVLGCSIAIFWAPFGSVINILTGLVPLAVFVVLMVLGPLRQAFRRLDEKDKQIADKDKAIANEKELAAVEIKRLTDQLQQKLSDDKMHSVEVQRWIESGNQLVSDLEGYPNGWIIYSDHEALSSLQVRADEWSRSVHNYVSHKFYDFTQRLISDENIPRRIPLRDQTMTNLRDGLANKVERLKELLEHLRSGHGHALSQGAPKW